MTPPSHTIRALHYATGQPIVLTTANGRITGVQQLPPDGPRPTVYVAPGFFDLQINGCLGRSFSSAQLTVDNVHVVVAECRRHGITSLCPTLITNSFAVLHHGLTTLRLAVESDRALANAIPCFHLEGPYISAEDGPRGAHPRQHVRRPDWDEFQRFQEAASGGIRLVTLAPEHDGALAFIEKLVQSDVVVAIGHTAAGGQRIRDAVKAGARLSTHLGNGCHAILPRHDNCIWEQLANDQLWASLICDGHHLPPAVIRSLIRGKSPSRVILTCDASSLAGLPPGRYREWEQDLEIRPEGKIVVAGTPYLAGSWAFTDACIGKAMKYGGVSLEEAIAMVTERPRTLLGLPVHVLEVGEPADVVVFEIAAECELHMQEA
jgi:N-acetylglucosamine-6-phosphate deacetylase